MKIIGKSIDFFVSSLESKYIPNYYGRTIWFDTNSKKKTYIKGSFIASKYNRILEIADICSLDIEEKQITLTSKFGQYYLSRDIILDEFLLPVLRDMQI